jgi:predicted nucleic acid-binding protein
LKILLDTTYLLPAIGISIKGLPTDIPINLMAQGNEIYISQITLFELAAKGAKYINDGALTPEKVTRGIRAIAYNDEIQTIATHESEILLTAFKLRKNLPDFIDCLILSSAITNCDALATQDADIHDLAENAEFRNLLATENPNFKIQALTSLLSPP